jgi:NAD(P)-dependent dehydrogenase (short-subunit alcohol dehydrogenase family)
LDLAGAVAVVTGAASGIGRATAIALARAGADVIVPDMNEDGARQTAAQVEAAGRRALPLLADVSHREGVEELVARSIDWQGHCDVFVSNVGVGCIGLPHEYTPDEWDYLLRVNLWSAIWPMRSIVPHMLKRDRGHLVFVSSGAGFEGTAERAPYNVAKFGIVGLAESTARSLKDTGVNVTLVVPGAIATDGWRSCVVADADTKGAKEVERVRQELRGHTTDWPQPEVMADAIVHGIKDDCYFVVQHNPYEPDWLASTLERKGRDPEGFVLGT